MDLHVDQSSLLSHLLSASVRRQEVIMGNIANLNTPGYQRRLVRFTMLHDEFKKRNTRGSDAVGWAATLNEYGAGPYEPMTWPTYKTAVRRAVRR